MCRVLPSRYIIRELQKQHDDALKTYFKNIIQHSKGSRGGLYFGTLAGRFFEDYAIRQICNGGKFTVKKISAGADFVEEITFPALAFPDDIEDIVDEHADIQALPAAKIGVPANPTFPAIDALCKGGTIAGVPNDIFFHMKNVNTVSSGAKKVKLNHLNRLHGYMSNNPVRLYQVVPDLNFASAKDLTYYNADGTVEAMPANMEEWMINIDTHGLSASPRKKPKTT